jgi:hypothetical protein
MAADKQRICFLAKIGQGGFFRVHPVIFTQVLHDIHPLSFHCPQIWRRASLRLNLSMCLGGILFSLIVL